MSTDYYRAITGLTNKALVEAASTRPWVGAIDANLAPIEFSIIALDPIPYEATPNLAFAEVQELVEMFPKGLSPVHEDGTLNMNPHETYRELSNAAAEHCGEQLGAPGSVWLKGLTEVVLEAVERGDNVAGHIVQFTRWGLGEEDATAGVIEELLTASGAELHGEWASEYDIGNMDDDFNLFDFLMER